MPRAVIRFKQGVGRLIRSHADRGRVVVLDPRVVTKPYGRAFLRALPAGIETR
jgi:ATP-dependent DNA helicase DinG